MKKSLVGLFMMLAACVSWQSSANAVQTTYKVAHIKVQSVNMVFIKVRSDFFLQDDKTKARWYSLLQSCSSSANLAGEVVAVANVNNRMVWYGPKKWSTFMSTTNMSWVDTRVNKQLSCDYG